MKTCCKCKEELPLSEFYAQKGGKYGKGTLCRSCSTKRMREYRKANPEKAREACKKYRESRPGENYERVKEWRASNPSKRHEQQKRHYKSHQGSYVAKVAKRKAAKLQRTPAWADLDAIRDFYENRPEGHHVDHIVPLQGGDQVSGLHVLENLQYLPAKENLSKSNKW
jgi:hypothetical protein